MSAVEPIARCARVRGARCEVRGAVAGALRPGHVRRLLTVALCSLISALCSVPAADFRLDRNGVPTWAEDAKHPKDVFTFVRLRYDSWQGRGGAWSTDYPDADLNFSWRLQQLTSLKVAPEPKVLEITDPELFKYPWTYMVEPGHLEFSEAEVVALRRYLLNGGFLMVDDFWGDDEWENFHREIRRVFPDREPVELDISHPVFHLVFDLKTKPQLPSIGIAMAGRGQGITWERGEEGRQVHFKGIFDDKGRMMAIICHNTDHGDGWEREGENEWYFRTFSEPFAYPMGINIVFYAMTH